MMPLTGVFVIMFFTFLVGFRLGRLVERSEHAAALKETGDE